MTDRELQIVRAAQRVAFAEGVTRAAADLLVAVDGDSAAVVRSAAEELRSLVDRLRLLRAAP